MSEELEQKDAQKPKYQKFLVGIDNLSLGISMVVAVVIGVGLGVLLKNLTGMGWTLWIGVFWGIAAAVLNVYKAYKRQQREYDELANDPKYAYKPSKDDDED